MNGNRGKQFRMVRIPDLTLGSSRERSQIVTGSGRDISHRISVGRGLRFVRAEAWRVFMGQSPKENCI